MRRRLLTLLLAATALAWLATAVVALPACAQLPGEYGALPPQLLSTLLRFTAGWSATIMVGLPTQFTP